MNFSGIEFTDNGKGHAVIYLHGHCENKEIWNDFLSNIQVSHRSICIDLPGFGDSSVPAEKPSLELYSDRIISLINHLDIHQFIIIGHSLGGYVALAMAETYPEKILGICLFHSSAFSDSADKKSNRDKSVEFIKKNGSAAYAPTLIDTLFAPQNKNRLQAVMNSLISIATATREEGIIWALQAMRDRKDRTIVLKNAIFPFLFIIGKDDTAIPLEVLLQQIALPQQSIVHILSDTGHMGMFEKPKETGFAVTSFINEYGIV